MRRFLSSVIALFYTAVFIVSPIVSAQAAEGDGTSPVFELTVPASARANEAFDVTVKALKADGTVNTTYTGSISFVVTPSGSGATIPANFDIEPTPDDPSNSAGQHIFTLTEQGQYTFSKAFSFPKEGNYEIIVIDNETLDEVVKPISITASNLPDAGSATVTIDEPVAQTTVNSDTLVVTGTSKPTSKVYLYIGSEKKSETFTNTDGGFQGTVSGLAEGANTIKVEVLDGNGKSIGSSTVTVNYSLDAPTINSLILKEGTQVFTGSTIHLEAVGDPGLKTVTVQFGDKPVVLTEDSTRPGVYVGTTQISNFEGEMKPTVNVESYQGTPASFSNLLNVNVISSSFENIKVEGTKDKKARFTFSLKTDLDEIKFFKIKYGTQPGKYDKEVTTFEKSQMKDGENYTWYIPGLGIGEYYATIIGLDKDKKELSLTSGEQKFALPLDSAAETCYIDKVSGVMVKRSGSQSIISWDKLDDAASYQIFKMDAEGEYTLLDEVTETSYKINIDMTLEEDVFEDFQIRATCKNGDIVGEGDYSESISVQTGPAMIAFMMLLIASGVAFILMKRGYLR